MSIIVTCGHENSGFAQTHAILEQSGLAAAKTSDKEQFSISNMGRAICDANKINTQDPASIHQIKPARVWQALSDSVMLANMDQNNWGWADPDSIYLLDYWLDYDPRFRFVLTYTSPARTIINLFMDKPVSEEKIAPVMALWNAVNSEILRFYNSNKDRAILVNTASVNTDPDQFLTLSGKRLELPTGINGNIATDTNNNSAIPELLTSMLLANETESQSLFQELESTADMPGDTPGQPQSVISGAWDHFNDLNSRLDQASKLVEQSQNSLADNQRQLQNLNTLKQQLDLENAQLKEKLADQKTKNEQLLQRLHQTQEEFETEWLKSRKTIFGLQEERKTAADSNSTQSKLESLYKQQAQKIIELEKANRELQNSTSNEEPKILQAKNNNLARENKLLVRQLHQVQEELELYFLKYREATSSNKNAAGTPESAKKTVTIVDMRRLIEGSNWFSAEHDGRWAGPGKKSTVQLPAIESGTYQIEFNIVGAMSPAIVRNMKVLVNGRQVALQNKKENTGFLAPLVGRKQKYPLLLTGTVKIGKDDAYKKISVEFDFPEVISPSKRGGNDLRSLAIRLEQIRLVRI